MRKFMLATLLLLAPCLGFGAALPKSQLNEATLAGELAG